MWHSLRRWLYLIHRWMGIAGCVLIAMWFVSGVVMMYVAFPSLTEGERLAGLPPLGMAASPSVTPDAALRAAGLGTFPRGLRLEMAGDRPVYRIVDRQGRPHTIDATDGTRIERVDAETARAIAARFADVPDASSRWIETAERDQWTVPNGLNAWRPLHRIAIDDGLGTELYVSARTGEVMRDTHRAERFWNWLGSVPHWLYFTPIRKDPPLWRQVVLWTSGPCVVVALTGIWIGILRLRMRKRFAHGSVGGVSPYHGWMAWHHVAGLAGALFLVFWLVSGWLSVNPNQWFNARAFDEAAQQRYAGHGAASFPEPAWREIAARVPDARELRMIWVAGRAQMLAGDSLGRTHTLDATTGAPVTWPLGELVRAAAMLVPDAHVVDGTLQREDDLYWYRHHAPRALPVLRVRFDDAAGTWAYIDPSTGLVAGRSDDNRRLYRWLFHAAHSWDFNALLRYRPAWDAVMWTLSLIGAAMSVSGIVVGYRRLKRKVR